MIKSSPEFLKNTVAKLKWLLRVFNTTIANGKLPKAFKRFKIVAVLKSDKEPELVESYCSTALLSEFSKLLGRLTYYSPTEYHLFSMPVSLNKLILDWVKIAATIFFNFVH